MSLSKETVAIVQEHLSKQDLNTLKKRYILPEPLKSETHEERHLLDSWDKVCNWKEGYPEFKVHWFDSSLSVCHAILLQGGKILLIKRHHQLYGGFLIFKVWKEQEQK